MGASHSALLAWEASYRGGALSRILTSAFLTMSIFVAVKITVLPASQFWSTERKGMCKFGI